MRTVPNMTVVAPKDGAEAAYWLGTLKDHPGPVYMRLVNDIACEAAAPTRHEPMVMLADSGPLLIVSTGAVTHGVLNALPSLAALALPARVLHVPLVHPFDVDACARLAAQAETIIVVEEHACVGGLGAAVLEGLAQACVCRPVICLGVLPSAQPAFGTTQDARETHRLVGERLVEAIAAACRTASD